MRRIKEIGKKCFTMVLCAVLVALTVFPDGVYAEWDKNISDTTIKVMDSAVSPSNVTINLFDYSLGNWTNPENGDNVALDNFQWWDAAGNANLQTALRDGYINYNHALLFGKGIIDGNSIINNFSGVDPWGIWNWCGEGDTMARKGMVKAALGADGYPVLNLQNLKDNYVSNTINGIQSMTAASLGNAPLEESLAYLFDPDTANRINYWSADCTTNDAANAAVESGDKTDTEYPAAGKISYTDVKGLLQYGTYDNEHGSSFNNSFYYDSQQNYAWYDAADNSFKLYSQPRIASSSAAVTARGQFFPFVEKPNMDTLNAGGDINHYFGMTLETEFYMPEDGMIGEGDNAEPMIFYFSGDDDAWIFLDGVLVGDVGGMHSPIGVTINFHTGEITYTDAGKNGSSTLKTAFDNAHGADQQLLKGATFEAGTRHTLKMFYMERGNYDSNLALSFNLYNPYSDYMLENKVVDKDGNPVSDDDTKFLFDVEFNRADVVTGLLKGEYEYVTDSGEKGIVVISVPDSDTNSIGKITEIKDSDGNTVTSSTYFHETEGKDLFAGEKVYQANLANGQWIKFLSLPDKAEIKTTRNRTDGYKLQEYKVLPEDNVPDGSAAGGETDEVIAKLKPYIADNAGSGDIDAAMTGLTTTTYYNVKMEEALLVVSKEVTHQEGVMPPDEEFEFTLTIAGQTGSLTAQREEEASGSGDVSSEDITLNFTNNAADFTLKADQTLKLKLPVGTHCEIQEKKASNNAFSLNHILIDKGDNADGDIPSGKVFGDIPSDGRNLVIKFTNRYLTSVTAVLNGSKALSGRAFHENDEFTFVIAADPADGVNQGPLPQKTRITIYPGKASVADITPAENTLAVAGSSFAFGSTGNEITFTKPGTYHYLISEVHPTGEDALPSVTYDATVFRATVNVVWDDTVKKLRLANGTNGEQKGITYESRKADNASWTAVDSDTFAFVNYFSETDLTLKATKNLTGRTFKEGDTFTFTMSGRDGAPMPEGTDGTTKVYTKSISYTDGSEGSMRGNSHDFDFASIHYTLEDAGKTYVYDLAETKGSQNGIAYDEASRTVSVAVTNTDGKLTADVTYPAGNPGTAVDRVVWNNTYTADEGSVTLGARKEISGREWSDTLDDGSYRFTLKAVTADAPMPLDGEGNPLTSQTVKNEGHNVEFSQIIYGEAGTYEYEITESNPDTPVPGVTRDDGVIKVTVTVTDSTDGELAAEAAYSYVKGGQTTPDGNTFTNIYEPAEISLTLEATKNLSGREFRAGDTFTFTMIGSEGAPMPEGTSGGTYTRTISCTDGSMTGDSHEFDFATIRYTLEDVKKTYTYTLKETRGTAAGITYDEEEKTVQVGVTGTDKDTLRANATYPDSYPEPDVNRVVWNNSYAAEADEVTVSISKEITGRDWSDALDDGSYRFTLEAVTEGAPMPLDGEGNPLVSQTVKNSSHTVEFSPVKYTEKGVYDYQITEEDSTVPGVMKDDGVIKVRVTVTDDTDGNLAAVPEYSYVKDGQTRPDEKTFINTYRSEDASVSITARKAVGDGYRMIGGDFNFHIRPADSNPAPDPVKEGFVSNDADGNIVFAENAVYTAQGTYRYDVHELSGRDGQQTVQGIIYDDNIFTVTVNVKNNPEKGILEAAVTYVNRNSGSAVDSIVFNNGYVPLNTSVLLWGSKTLNGKNLTDNEFTFELTPVSADYGEAVSGGNGAVSGGDGSVSGGNGAVSGGDGSVSGNSASAPAENLPVQPVISTDIPMPAVSTATNTAAGIFAFGEITFTEAGTYTYKITERNDGRQGYTYDSTEYTVTVDVADNGGQLTATVAGLDRVRFVNSYRNPEPEPEKPTPEKPTPEKPAPEKPTPAPQPAPTTGNSRKENSATAANSPKTGDDSKIMLWMALCAAALAVESGMLLLKRRRR